MMYLHLLLNFLVLGLGLDPVVWAIQVSLFFLLLYSRYRS